MEVGENDIIVQDLGLMKSLYSSLVLSRYQMAGILPMRKKPARLSTIIHEIYNFYRFLTGKRNTFAVSICPQLYQRIFSSMHFRQYILYQFFLLNRPIALDLLSLVISTDVIKSMIEARVIKLIDDDHVVAKVRIVCYQKLFLGTDVWDRSIPGMSYLSYDSLFLADFVKKRIQDNCFEKGLDLCTGTGVLALTIAERCGEVVATD